jgi:hypothetical protein
MVKEINISFKKVKSVKQFVRTTKEQASASWLDINTHSEESVEMENKYSDLLNGIKSGGNFISH